MNCTLAPRQWLIFLILIYLVKLSRTNECLQKDYGHGSIVCVCNKDHCDTVSPVESIVQGKYIVYTSGKSGQRFEKSNGTFVQDLKSPDNLITINAGKRFQEILGWGGAFTDAAGYNINSLNNETKRHLLRSYFSKDGIEYSMCRVPIGGSDLSLRYYSYDEVPGDVNLTRFSLTQEDFVLKIPFIKEALALTNNTLRLFGSTWNPPLWMKTNNKSSGFGFLKKQYYQTWAKYHIKFLDAYKRHGIKFWGITTGNEPSLGFLPFNDINSITWTPWDQGKWIGENLGPTIRKSEYYDTKIIAFDDQRLLMPLWMVLETWHNPSKMYIDGIGVHWYSDNFFPSFLTLTHFLFRDKFLLGTEACTGDKRFKRKVVLGAWRRGEMYADDIIEDLNNWVGGWVDWNMALDLKGGPTYIGNFVDSQIIVNKTSQEFYKQPTYYVMGHFSKFVPPGSFMISAKFAKKSVLVVAFTRPDQGTTVIAYNKHNKDVPITIYDERRGYISITIPKRTIHSIIYW